MVMGVTGLVTTVVETDVGLQCCPPETDRIKEFFFLKKRCSCAVKLVGDLVPFKKDLPTSQREREKTDNYEFFSRNCSKKKREGRYFSLLLTPGKFHFLVSVFNLYRKGYKMEHNFNKNHNKNF